MTGESTTFAWSNAITWILVTLGWYFVHRATLERERRKERREHVKNCIESLRALEQTALRFHTASTYDAVAADQLIYQTNRIIRSLQRMPMSELDIPLPRMIRVRKSITLHNLELKRFSPQSVGSPMLLEIRAAIDDLVDAVEEARDRHWK